MAAIGPSRTEQAICAAVAAIDTALSTGGPRPLRNELMDVKLEELGDGAAIINVLDGEQSNLVTFAGAAVSNNEGYDIVHTIRVEIGGKFDKQETRDAAIDGLMIKVHDALAADRRLGGVVDFVDTDVAQRENLNIEGIANAKAIVVPVKLTFKSNRPF
jgi:hypothetical protein